MTKTMRGLFCLLVMAASVPPEPVVGQQQQMDRHSYVPYPHAAHDLLLEEVATIGTPMALEVVTNIALPEQSNQVWQLLKGVVRRMHNQNQIIQVVPHYYITNGLDYGCRLLGWDEDTNAETEIEVVPVPQHCALGCTNHGRYCVIPAEAEEDPKKNSRGNLLVEETLRRICFIELYHGSDLRFWEYMEHFDSFGCHNAADIASCSSRVLGEVPRVEQRAIDNCMHMAGGIQGDTVNLHLKAHMDRQFKGSYQYNSVDVPFFRFGQQMYTGVKDAKHILEWVCSTFELRKGVTPVACTFCSQCLVVESCLWYLDCDGTPFTTEAFQSMATITAVPAIDTEPAPTTTIPTGEEAPETTPVTLSEPVEAAPSDETTVIGPESTTNAATVAPEPQQPSAVFRETLAPSTHAPFTQSPALAPVDLNDEVSTPSSQADTSRYHRNKDPLYKQESTSDYVLPVVIAFCLLAVYFILSFCYKSYMKHKKSDRQRTAEAYFDDLMEASYADNLAVSGRIEDENSDREFEDGYDESYRYPDGSNHGRNIRQHRDSSSEDEDEDSSSRLSATKEPPKPPPLYSFKVHQVLG
ncbi:Vacuolar-sorting receptor [Seminavis robusta]|uniref:Vacuolar-sorting receptor n=1 Tax=Seminavis robusta TaxID=568900 RepID=A0A9N8DBN3_9STRA|nr:Vacuolar-sorting receptor [Seminavis robusta]|eukprot:Sro21_g014570.1 Vacuolar-sorting receptor (581) ;mRNA; r:45060-46924